MNLMSWIALIGEIIALIGAIVPVVVAIHKIAKGTRCQLRSEMLRIYYHNRETRTIRQYEFENFVMLYEAYKKLGGNSFVDKIKDEVHEFEIIS